MIKNMMEYKYACIEFLSNFALNSLRSYGRSIGVSNPTKDKKKNVLIEEIVAVLAGEVMPQSPSTRGAPIKNDFIDPKITEGLKQIRRAHLKPGSIEDTLERMRELEERPNVFTVADSNSKISEDIDLSHTYVGQLETINGISTLLPLNCISAGMKVLVPIELIRKYDLHEGDVIDCTVEMQKNIFSAVKIIHINGMKVEYFRRSRFDGKICYPYQKIKFCEYKQADPMVAKLLEWLVVVGKGQRGLVVAPPKTGKTALLTDMATYAKRANSNFVVVSLLIDQAPEAIALYRDMVGGDNLLYSTYEDSPERQMFVAEFALKRAKSYAESGKDVLLLVDSFNAMSRAFNETDESLGGKTLSCGLESKTIQYLKRYFGTARCLEKGGSLTIIGALSINTGNPADDLLNAELSPVSNLDIVLTEELAKRRIFPAIDLLETRGKRNSNASGIHEGVTNDMIRGEYLSSFDIEDLHRIIMNADNFQTMEKEIFKQLKTKKK